MNTPKHAHLPVYGCDLWVRRIREDGQRPVEVAQAMGASARTAYQWLARYRAEGPAGRHERSPRPARCPHRLSEATRPRIVALRRQRRIYRSISRQVRVGGGRRCPRAPADRPEPAGRA